MSTNPPPLQQEDTALEIRFAALAQQVAGLQERVAFLETNSLRLDRIFRPAVGFAVACAFTAAFALVCFAVFKGDELKHYLYYMTPIVFPFVGYVFERFNDYFRRRLSSGDMAAASLDVLVVALSLARSAVSLPFFSGHALFLGFALPTVRTWWVRIPVILVLAEVVYFKAFIWRDSSLYGGLLMGFIAAILWKRLIGKGR